MYREKRAGNLPPIDNPERNTLYARLWEEACRELSVRCEIDEKGYIRIEDGSTMTLMFQNLLQIDHPVTLKIARDKAYVLDRLAEAGVPVPPFMEFTLASIERAEAFLREHGTCVVKPSYGAAGGDGVTTNITSPRQLRSASVYASLFSPTLLVERQIEGESYRLLYLDGELIDAIRRSAPSVVGDGASSVRELVDQENERRKAAGGSRSVTRLIMDEETRNTLEAHGLTPASVPAAGERVVVRQAVNDNSSSENERLDPLPHPSIIAQGATAAAVVGVALAGVDLITTDIARPLAETGGIINEVNVTPGLHYHYQVFNPGASSRVAVPVLRRLLRLKPDKSAGRRTDPDREGAR
jgi:cyanophycin synthetase